MSSKPYLKRMSRNGVGSAHAFTLVELLVVMGIIVILVSLLLPVFRKTREMSNRAVCSSNLHQIVAAAMSYQAANGELPENYRTQFNDTAYPAFVYWPQWAPYLDERGVFSCPGGRTVSEVYAPNPDGNWTGDKILGAYFYVAGIRNPLDPNLSSLSDFGATPAKAAASEARICKNLQGNTSGRLLATEGVEVVAMSGTPDTVYFSHNDVGLSDRASYEGFHIYVDKSRMSDFAGFNQGFADGHVAWVPSDSRSRNAQVVWDEDYTFRHYTWSRFYW